MILLKSKRLRYLGVLFWVRQSEYFLGFMAKIRQDYFLLVVKIFLIVKVLGSNSILEQEKANRPITIIKIIIFIFVKVDRLIAFPNIIIILLIV